MTDKASFDRRAVILLVAAIWIAFSAALIQNMRWPNLTFDPTFYVGLVKADRPFDDAEVFAATRSELQRPVWTDGPDFLTNKDYYPQRVLNDPKIHAREASYYRIKVGYIGLSRLVYSITGDALASLRIVSLAGIALIILVPPLILIRRRAWFGLVFLPAIWVGCELFATARLVTPDILGIGVSLVLVWAWLRQSRFGVLACGAIITSIRPEFSFFALGIFLAAMAARRFRPLAALVLTGSFLVSVAVKMTVAYPGWWQHLSMVLMSPEAVVDGAPPFSMALLVGGAVNVWSNAGLHANWLWALLALAILYASAPRSDDPELDGCSPLFWGLMLGTLGRLFAFPMIEARLYLPAIMMCSILLFVRNPPDATGLVRTIREGLGSMLRRSPTA